MCIGATESTTNSRASGFVEDGAGNDQTFAGEKIATLSFSFSLRMSIAIFHAPLRAHRSCFKVSFSDVSSKFRSMRAALQGPGCRITPCDGPFSDFFTVLQVPFENCTLNLVLKNFETVRKIDSVFGGCVSWTTQPKCFDFFNEVIEPFPPDFFGFL